MKFFSISRNIAQADLFFTGSKMLWYKCVCLEVFVSLPFFLSKHLQANTIKKIILKMFCFFFLTKHICSHEKRKGRTRITKLTNTPPGEIHSALWLTHSVVFRIQEETHTVKVAYHY